MGSSESTGRSNGGEEEDERPTETNRSSGSIPNRGAAAVAIGTAAVAAWGVSRMFSDDDEVKDEEEDERPTETNTPNLGTAAVAIGTAAVAAWGVSRMLSGAPPRRFKLNTDGSCLPDHENAGKHGGIDPDDDVKRGPSGYAGVLEDDGGNLVRGFRGFIDVSDCFTAEVHGICKGLEFLDKFGYKDSILENDSEAAVGWVTRQNDGRSKSQLVRNCWNLIEKSRQLVLKNNITVRCCSRNDNKHADKLAKIAINRGEEYVEFKDVDREINSAGQRSSFYG